MSAPGWRHARLKGNVAATHVPKTRRARGTPAWRPPPARRDCDVGRSDDPRFIVSRFLNSRKTVCANSVETITPRRSRTRRRAPPVSPFPFRNTKVVRLGHVFLPEHRVHFDLDVPQKRRARVLVQRAHRQERRQDGPSADRRPESSMSFFGAASAGSVVLAHRPEKRVVRRERRHAFGERLERFRGDAYSRNARRDARHHLPRRVPRRRGPRPNVQPTRASEARLLLSAISRASRMRSRISAKAIVGLGHTARQHALRFRVTRVPSALRAPPNPRPAARRTAKWPGSSSPCCSRRLLRSDARTRRRAYSGRTIVIRSRSETSFGDLSLLSRAAAALTSDRHTQFPFKSQHSAQANVERPQTTWCRAARRRARAGEISGFPQKGIQRHLSLCPSVLGLEVRLHRLQTPQLQVAGARHLQLSLVAQNTAHEARACGPPFRPEIARTFFARGFGVKPAPFLAGDVRALLFSPRERWRGVAITRDIRGEGTRGHRTPRPRLWTPLGSRESRKSVSNMCGSSSDADLSVSACRDVSTSTVVASS